MVQLYEKFIPIIFGNYETPGTDQFFDDAHDSARENLAVELHENPHLVLNVLHTAFTNFEDNLSGYSVYQLSNGLDYIFNPSFSDYGFVFQNQDSDKYKRLETLQCLSKLMLHIFEDSAEPVLGHLNQHPNNPRNDSHNGICYMFWDTAAIPYNCDQDIIETCLAVMGKCAQSRNIAVVEGALHGLGHAQLYSDQALIDKYIDGANIGSGDHVVALRRYADLARRGCVL